MLIIKNTWVTVKLICGVVVTSMLISRICEVLCYWCRGLTFVVEGECSWLPFLRERRVFFWEGQCSSKLCFWILLWCIVVLTWNYFYKITGAGENKLYLFYTTLVMVKDTFIQSIFRLSFFCHWRGLYKNN